MTDPQYIPKDWAAQIEQHIATMESAFDEAQKHGPGEEHDRQWDVYEGTCLAFLDHVERHFNSPAGFASFLESDIRTRLSAEGLSIDHKTDEDTWTVNTQGPILTAERLSSIYRITYSETIDALAHRKAFHHAAPAPELMTL